MAVLLLGGCDSERISKLEKQNQELQSQVKKDRAVADYDLQAKCAGDSKVWFFENWSQRDKDTISLTYTNHYNKRLNKCFIMVEYHYSTFGRSWTNSMSLWDVYENSKYGDIDVNHAVYLKPEFHTEESVASSCSVYGKACKTLDEFNSLVRPYLVD
jgi:hypothetical protein